MVPVAADVDGIVEEDVAARRDQFAPALVVGARALVGVVAVDEDERARTRRGVGRPGVADDEVNAVREVVAIERRAQLGVQPGPAHVGAERDVEVVRPELRPVGERAREHQRRAALEAADLGDRCARSRVLREPVEQRRLVELERRDPVAELVRGEEEGEILEAVERLRPPRHAQVSLQAGIRLNGGVDEVLADPRPPCGAERPLHEVAQHAGSLVQRSQVAPRLL